MSHRYTMTDMPKVEMALDRATFVLHFDTTEGRIALKVHTQWLDALISKLHEVEYQASLLDPLSGQQPGEPAEVRVEMAQQIKMATSTAGGIACIVLRVESGGVVRHVGFPGPLAKALQQYLQAEIPRMERSSYVH